jgi:hypothetical protein
MKKLIAAICFMFALSPLAYAQDKAKADDKKAAPAAEKATKAAPAAEKAKKEPSEKQKAQQERMKACNDKATDKKGDDRKKFMSSCLKGEDAGASDKQKAQQSKMKSCNKDAGDKKPKDGKKPGDMSPQEAQKLLDRLGDQEKQNVKKEQARRPKDEATPEKDW